MEKAVDPGGTSNFPPNCPFPGTGRQRPTSPDLLRKPRPTEQPGPGDLRPTPALPAVPPATRHSGLPLPAPARTSSTRRPGPLPSPARPGKARHPGTRRPPAHRSSPAQSAKPRQTGPPRPVTMLPPQTAPEGSYRPATAWRMPVSALQPRQTPHDLARDGNLQQTGNGLFQGHQFGPAETSFSADALPRPAAKLTASAPLMELDVPAVSATATTSSATTPAALAPREEMSDPSDDSIAYPQPTPEPDQCCPATPVFPLGQESRAQGKVGKPASRGLELIAPPATRGQGNPCPNFSGDDVITSRPAKRPSGRDLQPQPPKSSRQADGAALASPAAVDQPREPRIPPIILDQPKEWASHAISIGQLTRNDFTVRCNGRVLRIATKTIAHFRAVQRYLQEHDLAFHTFALSSERLLKVVVRGLPSTLSQDEILNELQAAGHGVTEAKPLKSRRGQPTGLWVLTVRNEDGGLKATDIYDLNRLFFCRVTVQKYTRPTGPIQCHRCQGFGHGSSHCGRAVRCVRCAGDHPSSLCLKATGTPATCSNCSQNHSANYKGCPAYKAETKSPQKSYAAAAAPKRPAPPGGPAPRPARSCPAPAACPPVPVARGVTSEPPVDDDGFRTVQRRRNYRQPRNPANRRDQRSPSPPDSVQMDVSPPEARPASPLPSARPGPSAKAPARPVAPADRALGQGAPAAAPAHQPRSSPRRRLELPPAPEPSSQASDSGPASRPVKIPRALEPAFAALLSTLTTCIDILKQAMMVLQEDQTLHD